ncbi:MAG: penicillin-binding protein 2 [Candidatus Limnocylindrales bacterium]
MLGRTDSRGRLLLLLAVLVLLCSGMTARLAYWQVNQHGQATILATQDTLSTQQSIPAKRGTIYDRTGTVVLAQTIYEYRIVADLHGLSAADRKRYGLATNVDPDIAKEISDAQANGDLATINLEPTPVRVYPQAGGAPHTSLAAQLLGFVNASGVGQYGLEQEYDSILAGRPELVSVDPNTPGPAGEHVIDPGAPGQDIRTTIDAGLQLKVEQEVFAAWLADKAKTVSAIVMDPKTGAVLAEASYPSYDANLYSEIAAQNPALFMDPIISEVYEPGSVFKMLTASAALQTKTTALSTMIDDTGVLKLPGGQEVADADRKAKGWMTFADIVAWSRNVGASRVAFRLGKTIDAASAALYKTWQTYGIGQLSGIDLAGEVSGLVRDPATSPWRQIDLANASFGQGVAVTPIQIMRAYCAMANGGMLVTPHVATVGAGTAAAAPSSGGRRVISAGLSSSLTGLMEHVVTAVPSYHTATYIPGYYVGGKTGTAQIWDPTLNRGKGGWMDNIYNYSFYGWVGQDSPELAIGAVIYQGTPTKVAQGVLNMPVQSTQLFRRIATDSVLSEHIPSDKTGPTPPAGQTAKSLG